MAAPKSKSRALELYSLAVLAFMVLTILWGAYVRISGSGAGCGKHWPFCNGELIPHNPRIQTIIEFAHRSMSGFLTTLIVVLAAWVFRRTPKGHAARRAVTWVLILLVTEALLGAALVLGGWVDTNASDTRAIMQCIHFTNTMLLLAAFTLTWWCVRPASSTTNQPGPHSKDLALSAALLTLLTGATGSVAALADTLFPSPTLSYALQQDFAATAPLLVRMRWIHPAATALAILCMCALCWRLRSPAARFVLYLVGLQIALGIGDVLLLAPAWLQIAHLLFADLLWIALIVLLAETLRNADAEKPDRRKAGPKSGSLTTDRLTD